jgi:hypothetical protein
MNCPKCNSITVVAHTDKDLRKDHSLVWQCMACEHFWETGYTAYDEFSSMVDHKADGTVDVICPHCNIKLANKGE